jgi:hypothetical protein
LVRDLGQTPIWPSHILTTFEKGHCYSTPTPFSVYLFDRKVAFYTRQSGRQIDRKLIITPFVDNHSGEIGLRLGVEICTDITVLS